MGVSVYLVGGVVRDLLLERPTEDVDLVVIVRKAAPEMTVEDVAGEWRRASKTLRRQLTEARKDRESRDSALAQRP